MILIELLGNCRGHPWDRPRTRYAAGRYAKPLMWARKWLGDRIFDRIIMSQMDRMS